MAITNQLFSSKFGFFRIFSLSLSFWQSGTAVFGMHFTVSRQGSHRQYSIFGGIIDIRFASVIASGHHQFALFFHFAIYNNQTKQLWRSGMPFMSIRFSCYHASVSVFEQSSASLSIARMLDDTQTECGERFTLRYCIWHCIVKIFGGQATLLLLASIQCQSVWSAWTIIQVYK